MVASTLEMLINRPTTPALSTCRIAGNCVEVEWDNAATSSFHAVWLRDNCRCDRCGDPAIGR
ncbi:MAG: gamma-butyrobetaine hydroxylase-like domain-containing protein, partial [Pseudomonadota bacterium]